VPFGYSSQQQDHDHVSDFSGNTFWDGMALSSVLLMAGSNATEDRPSDCALWEIGCFHLAKLPALEITTLQRLVLGSTHYSYGVALIEMDEQNSHHITDLDLRFNETIGNEESKSPSQVLGNKNALPNLKRPLFECHIGDEGCIELVSVLEQNTSLLQLDLRNNTSERVILAYGESTRDQSVTTS
jgi:hypothetical protein